MNPSETLKEAFEGAPIGIPPARAVAIVDEQVRTGVKLGLADDEIAETFGMSIAEVWSVRKKVESPRPPVHGVDVGKLPPED